MLKHFWAFMRGIVEYRSSFTTAVSFPYDRSYDRGREFAHMITLRRYEY